MGRLGRNNQVFITLLCVVAVSFFIYRKPFQEERYDLELRIPRTETNTTIPGVTANPANRTWQEQRKLLLSEPGRVKKVIIFAYMRGGSSIIGETFGHDNEAFYWYEPLDQFYNDYFGYKIFSIPLHITYTLDEQRRVPGEAETARIVQFFDNLYSCRFDKVPREMLIHPFVGKFLPTTPLRSCIEKKSRKINSCKDLLPKPCKGPGSQVRDSPLAVKYGCSLRIDELRQIHTKNHDVTNAKKTKSEVTNKTDFKKFEKHEQCMRTLVSATKGCVKSKFNANMCKIKTMQVSKVLRANMETMEHILLRMPDVHIVHYFRDPRAIAMSVDKVADISFMGKPGDGVVLKEVAMVCKKMKRDIEMRKEMEAKYPGAFTTLRYEDLVIDTQSTVKGVYKFLGRTVPSALWDYLQKALHDTGTKEGSFTHSRRNATETSMAWRKDFPRETLTKARDLCKSVLVEMGYPLDFTKT